MKESQRNILAPRGTETTEKVGEEHISETLAGGRRDTSKPGSQVHWRRAEKESEKAGTEKTEKPRPRGMEKELKKVRIGHQQPHSLDQERELWSW